MQTTQPAEWPSACPECGAAFSGEGTYCWLCGWRLGDPVSSDPKLRHPARVNPFVPLRPTKEDLRWTFRLSTMFLWTALVAVVMGVVRIAPGLGIPLGILSIPAVLHATAVAINRKRRFGETLTVGEKVAAFVQSFALTLTITFAATVAAIVTAVGALFVICLATPGRLAGIAGATAFIVASVAGLLAFVGLFAYFVHRAVNETRD